MPPPKILILEDEFLIRFTLTEALTEDGFTVAQASTGPEALEALAADPGIALLLTDVQLPGGLDGMEVAQRARERLPDLPVIFMTGRPDSPARDAVSGRDLFIAKPYLPSEICAAARRLTGR